MITKKEFYIKRKRRRRKIVFRRITKLVLFIGITVGLIFLIKSFFKSGASDYKERKPFFKSESRVEKLKNISVPEWVDVQLIHRHSTARTGTELSDIKNIVIHYVGNPKTTAQNNRDFFDKDDTEVSSHFVVGLNGEIIQCVPLYEKSAASNERNNDSISIEVCHPDASGKFSTETYNSLVKLTAWLLSETGLNEENVIRHYDITGKLCPLYFVEHDDKWKDFKSDVKTELLNLKK